MLALDSEIELADPLLVRKLHSDYPRYHRIHPIPQSQQQPPLMPVMILQYLLPHSEHQDGFVYLLEPRN